MFLFRGDVHKFYLKLKRTFQKGTPIRQLKEISELDNIRNFYEQLSTFDLIRIRYRVLKEKGGNGIIPILVSAIPWLGFIFSKQLESFFDKGAHLILLFLFLYTLILAISVMIHYREKAWTAVHLEIIEDILHERDTEK